MAEVVFQSLEDRLPELEELEREGVFSREELRVIIKRRTDFEYKLQKRVMEKKDVLNYLQYEIKLDLLRKKRSKKLKLKPYSAASLGMNRKIHSLFRKGLMKFHDDLSLWMQYIDFCKKTNSQRALGLAYGKLLQQHSNNPDLWLMAAQHEAEEMRNIESARRLFQKALRINKTSSQLWHEYFRLELLHVDKIKKRKKVLVDGGMELNNEEEDDEPKQMEEFLLNKIAEIVFSNAIKMIDSDIDFRLKFVSICQNFDDTNELEELIYKSIEVDFPEDESFYAALCVRPITKLKKESFVINESTWINVENEVDTKFQEALLKKKTHAMFEKYLDCFAKMMKESTSPEQAKRRLDIVLKVLSESEEAECISELSYLLWSEILVQTGKPQDALNCLKRAVLVYHRSLPIWQNYLLMEIEKTSSWECVSKEIKKCISSLDNCDQLPIWKLYIDASAAVSEEEAELAFTEVLNSPKVIKDTYLPQYLKWIHEVNGISSARKFYEEQLNGIVNYDFLQSCIALENLQEQKKVKKLRSLYEKVVNDYGSTSSDVWLSYIHFEKDNAADDFDRIGNIYLKAKKTLSGKLNAEFISQYSLM